MSKASKLATSVYSAEAAQLLGNVIRRTRINRRMTNAELAERLGVSCGLVSRIEKGDTGCSIGAFFEAAAVLGVPLFEADSPLMSARLSAARGELALIPKHARKNPGAAVKDDF